MNKITTKKTQEAYNLKHTIKLPGGNIICEEGYVDGKLDYQFFRPSRVKHKKAYEAKSMRFYYFGGPIDFTSMSWNDIFADYCEKIGDEIQVTDLKNFNDFDNLYCIWTSMDGTIWKINDTKPVVINQRLEIWGSEYDLDAIKKHLKDNKRVAGLYDHKNCPANYDISGHYKLYVEYKPTRQLMDKLLDCNHCSWTKAKIARDYFKLEKFKKPKPKEPNYDDDYYY